MSIRLYVGNLPAELDREGLEKVFSESGDSISLKIISDTKTGKCRGFGFVTVETPEAATTVIEKFNGYDFNGTLLKLEEALPRAKGQQKDGEGNEGGDEISDTPKPSNPIPKAQKQTSGQNSNKSRKSSNNSSSSSSDEPHQPDPRWANQLESFKQQLLASQAAN